MVRVSYGAGKGVNSQQPCTRLLLQEASVIWNQLPVSVRHYTSVSSFNASLKTFLFQNLLFGPIDLALYTCVCVCVLSLIHI